MRQIPIRFISTHRADSGHVDPLREAALLDPRFCVVDDNSGIVFVQGDRTELLGAVMSAVADNAVIAHAGGGERTRGSTDDRVRDAMTKLAHLHYPVHAYAARRLIHLGEDSWRICVAGEVGVDTIMAMKDVELPGRYNEAKAGDVVIAVHPVTGRPIETRHLLAWLSLQASVLATVNAHAWIVMPNGDPGSDAIMESHAELARGGHATMIEGLSHPQFLTLMKRCGTIIGNSSSLITEAPHLGVLPILIGTRQEGRVPAESDGRACEKILNHMASLWHDPSLREKE